MTWEEPEGMEKQEAIEVENVLIRAGDCSVSLLPQLGGKISSIAIHQRELLQPPLAPLAPRTRTMAFDASDASGWDECLPSVAACDVRTPAGVAHVPDHGDLWRVAWEPVETASAKARFLGRCFSLPLELERTVELTQAAGAWHLKLHYTVRNVGEYSAPWSWAAHPLFLAEPGDQILLPGTIDTLRLEGSGGGRLGKFGDAVSWPIAVLADGGRTDLSLAQPPNAAIGDKLFAGPLMRHENWCALVRPGAGLRIRVRFDAAATPYLGLWICHGGWPDRPGPKQTCVALEPATAPVDSLAIDGPWSRSLAPGESFSWPMSVDFELTQNGKLYA